MDFNDLNSLELAQRYFHLENDKYNKETKENRYNEYRHEIERFIMYIRS